jgi:hypothetical protein
MKLDKRNKIFPNALIPQNSIDKALLTQLINTWSTQGILRIMYAPGFEADTCSIGTMFDVTATDVFGNNVPVYLVTFRDIKTDACAETRVYPTMVNDIVTWNQVNRAHYWRACGQMELTA